MAAIGTRKLKLEIDGVERSVELTNARLAPADSDSDTITFADAAAGGKKDWHLQFTAVQDAAAGTIWSAIFDESGTDVPYTFMPYGNAVPSEAEPHFTGTVTIGAPDGDFLGGEANASNTSKFTFDGDWICTDKPTKVTTAV